MRIGILAQSEGFYFRDLARAAAHHQVECLLFSELRSEVAEGEVRVLCGAHDLASFDAVLVRTMPPGSLEQVIVRMDQLALVEMRGTLVINPPRSLETAVDKFLTSAKLAAAGIATPRTLVCQGWESALEAFEQLGGKAVIKPLFGGEGRGISLLTDIDLAERTFKLLAQLGAVIYLQEYIDHGGADLRILFVGDEHLAIRRENKSDWRTNASRGAVATPARPTLQQLQLARRAGEVVGAPIAGVDLLSDREGRDWVIEVNAVPGWKATAKALEVDVAEKVIEYVRRRVGVRVT